MTGVRLWLDTVEAVVTWPSRPSMHYSCTPWAPSKHQQATVNQLRRLWLRDFTLGNSDWRKTVPIR